jgi:hypothetical protein
VHAENKWGITVVQSSEDAPVQPVLPTGLEFEFSGPASRAPHAEEVVKPLPGVELDDLANQLKLLSSGK